MDVLQKEIDEVYATHPTAHEALDNGIVEQHQQFVRSLTEVNGGCAVISDLSNRKSYVTVHPWANFLGLTPEEAALSVIDSMDEDCIYRRIHPEDLVEKRLMEYKFFQKTFSMSPGERLKYRGRCRLRMMNEKGVYQYIDNLVQIMQNTPAGNVWLIFCLYSLSAGPTAGTRHLCYDNPDGTWGSRNIIPFGRAPQYPFRTRKGNTALHTERAVE